MYSQYIQKDYQAARERTHMQLQYAHESHTCMVSNNQLLRQENQRIVREIKYLREAIEDIHDEMKFQEKNMIKDLGRGFTKKTESEADNLSISVTTGTAGAHGSKLIAKVEKISRSVQNMIVAKKPMEGLFSVLEAAKAAFTNLKHVTLFLVDPALQYFMTNMPKHRYKDVPIEGIQSG